MISGALLATLLAATGEVPTPISLAAPGLQAVNVDEKAAAFYSDHLAQQMLLEGIKVVTASEIGALIGMERQKQLLGCGETEASCIAELGAALGVDGLLMGSVGKFGNAYQVNAKVVGSSDATSLAAYSERVGDDAALLDALNRAARAMADQLFERLKRPKPDEATRAKLRASVQPLGTHGTAGAVSPTAWIVGGAVLAGAGTAGVLIASGAASRIRARENADGSAMSYEQAKTLAAQSYAFEYGGYAALGAGVGLLGYGIFKLVAPSGPGYASIVIGDGGAAACIGGAF